jgi:hypothetical protein
MSEMVGYCLMLFSVLHFMNLHCGRPVYDLSGRLYFIYNDKSDFLYIGCPTSSIAQCAMREAAPHARGVSKARQL